MNGKLIVFSAPSGAGKTSIIKYLLDKNLSAEFSISATTRKPRKNEKNGIDYHFMSVGSFKKKIKNKTEKTKEVKVKPLNLAAFLCLFFSVSS